MTFMVGGFITFVVSITFMVNFYYIMVGITFMGNTKAKIGFENKKREGKKETSFLSVQDTSQTDENYH